MPQPGDPDPFPDDEPRCGDHDLTHNLMPRHDRQPVHGQIAVHDVQTRAAHPAGEHPHQQLARSG